MSSKTLVPTQAADLSGDWENESGAVGYPGDGDGAYNTGGGFLALKATVGGEAIPNSDAVIGFEVEFEARTNGPVLVLDSFTDTAGTLLRNHDGEVNADWRKPTTGAVPSDLAINAAGRVYYTFLSSGSPSNNGGEHFLNQYTPPSADYAVEAVIRSASLRGDYCEIYARATTPYTFYILQYRQSDGRWALGYLDSPSRTSPSQINILASYIDPIPDGSAKTARLEARGNLISAYIDGAIRMSANSSAITGAGYPGLRLDGAAEGGVTVVAAYDLGTPTTVTRFRRRIGYAATNAWGYVVEGSNDGVSWFDAFTGFLSVGSFHVGFTWDAEEDSTDVTATPYRYWRTVVTGEFSADAAEARIGDFRLYTASGLVSPGGSVETRGGYAFGYAPPAWSTLASSSAFTDNSPGDNSTSVGGGFSGGTLADSGLQFDSYKVDELLPNTLSVYLSSNGSTPNGDGKTLLLTGDSTYRIEGSPVDLWGGSWAVADVKNPNFSILFERGEAGAVAWIDAAQAIIYHTSGDNAMPTPREVVRQQTLIGLESSLGGGATADVRLRHMRIQPQPATEYLTNRPGGEKLQNHHALLKEHAVGPIDGIPTYDEMGWPLAGVIAKPATSVLSAGAAFRHVFVWNNRARDDIATFECQYGDVFSRAHSVVGMIIQSFGLGIRQDGVDVTGSILAKKIEDGIAMSSGAATVQTLTQSGLGTFTLRFNGYETAALTAGGTLTASDIQTALRNLAPINSSTQLTVTGVDGGPFTITFGNNANGPFKGFPQPILEYRVLTGAPTVAVSMTTVGGHVEYPGELLLPRHIEFFLTDTLADIASEKVSDAFVTNFNVGNRATPVYNLDRAEASWFTYAEPGNMEVNFELMVHADSNGMAFLPQGRSDALLFLRLLATGSNIGATSFPHRLQIDCPVKVSNVGPFGENQELYAFEYQLAGAFDPATNTSLVVTLDNGVESYS